MYTGYTTNRGGNWRQIQGQGDISKWLTHNGRRKLEVDRDNGDKDNKDEETADPTQGRTQMTPSLGDRTRLHG